jgi:hypothetical protein
LLGLDETKEVCLAVVHVLGNDSMADASVEQIAGLPGEMRSASQRQSQDRKWSMN